MAQALTDTSIPTGVHTIMPDWKGIGVDRTAASGTGYTAQYNEPVASMYENIETCPRGAAAVFPPCTVYL